MRYAEGSVPSGSTGPHKDANSSRVGPIGRKAADAVARTHLKCKADNASSTDETNSAKFVLSSTASGDYHSHVPEKKTTLQLSGGVWTKVPGS